MTDQGGGRPTPSLPAGTVTLLLADVEGSTRLWETEPEAMRVATARLDALVDEVVAGHGGVRPVEQGEGDSFVAGFARASDALAAALDLQHADLAPIRLRIGIHTGEVQLRDEANYAGPAMNRAARLRNLASGGQTVLSGATADLVVDHLPPGAWLADLGTHRLRDLARPERVHQLCAPDFQTEFPPLASLDAFAHNLPVQLTSFVGRADELAEVGGLLAAHRLVTLIGAGGAGKTRLALQLAAEAVAGHPDGVWLADLSPVTDPKVVPIAVARALGLLDDPTTSTLDQLIRFLRARSTLLVVDNCEHLVAPTAAVIDAILRSCPSVVVLSTSREPLGVVGEVSYRVPSLPEAAAVELFVDQAARSRPGFALTEANTPAVAEICRRLDGIPLAIELAAARVRVLAPEQIAAGLDDRFRLLTGGARTALPRQQTLRASVDWSHAQLTEPERVLFARLAVMAGSFELAGATAVGAGEGLEPYQVLDQLSLLVDKTLVLALEGEGEARYRLPETVRHYAIERLEESGEADLVRDRHLRHYLRFVEEAFPGGYGSTRAYGRVDPDLDNLRAAFAWSQQGDDPEPTVRLATGMYSYFTGRGYVNDGVSWIESALAQPGDVTPARRAVALGLSGHALGVYAMDPRGPERADEALAMAREIGDPRLVAFALTALGMATPYFAPARSLAALRQAVALARQSGPRATLAMALEWLGIVEHVCGDGAQSRPLLEEAAKLGGQSAPAWLTNVMVNQGDLAEGIEAGREIAVAAEAHARALGAVFGWTAVGLGSALAGRSEEGRKAGGIVLALTRQFGAVYEEVWGQATTAAAELADGRPEAALEALADADDRPRGLGHNFGQLVSPLRAEAHLGMGDLARARADATRGVALGREGGVNFPLGWSLRVLARIEAAEGNVAAAEDAVHEALTVMGRIPDRVGIADALEQLGVLGGDDERAARLLGAAEALLERCGAVRFEIHRAWYDSALARIHNSLGDDAFGGGWAEGRAMSMEDAVAYAQRGRGPRRRPAFGWDALTRAEVDVVRLVGEGLANKEIADKLFISPRTVQAHLTHAYGKLGISSRVQLAQEAARQA